jgi:hypothetical protein
MQLKAGNIPIFRLRSRIQALRRPSRITPNSSVNLVSEGKEMLRQIHSILTGNAND